MMKIFANQNIAPNSAPQKPLSKKQKIVFWSITAIIAIMVVGAVVGNKPKENSDTILNSDGSFEAFNGIELTTFSEKCDDYLIIKNLVPSNISMTDVWNGNLRMWDSGAGYDKDGNKILIVQWNGKNKDSGDKVGFTCWVSGSDKDNIIVHEVSMDGQTLDGILITYDENGSRIEE